MQVQVNRSQLQHTLRSRIDHYTAEASELGFPVGCWPTSIKVPGLGNGQPFHIVQRLTQGDELAGYEYRQCFGCIAITVFND